MKSVLVTGATGFLGTAVCAELKAEGFTVRAAVRPHTSRRLNNIDEIVEVGNIDAATNWDDALDRVDVVIHLAARVHILSETTADPIKEFRDINRDGTVRLAQSAASIGVSRLVYVSSIKVNGDETDRVPFSERSYPNPQGPYAVSKWEAEQELSKIAGLELTIIRPPLIYGPGVKGNFLNLLRWVNMGVPLPFGGTHNLRSLVGLGNISNAIVRCIQDNRAIGETFLVSDGEDLSTTDLIQRLAKQLNRSANIFPFPAGLLNYGAMIIGKKDLTRKIFASLQVDANKLRETLDWKPPLTLEQELYNTATWFKSARDS